MASEHTREGATRPRPHRPYVADVGGASVDAVGAAGVGGWLHTRVRGKNGGSERGHVVNEMSGASDDRLPNVPGRIIDSFLVLDGRAIGVELHRRRTVAAVADAFGTGPEVPNDAQLRATYASAFAEIPREGEWFPLFEVLRVDEGIYSVTVNARRPAPPRRATTKLALASDRRRFPAFKGADGDVAGADRATAREVGDDDALYVDPRGRVIEAANGTVVGWRGNEMFVPDTSAVLPSTTLGAMTAHLRERRAARSRLEQRGELEPLVDDVRVRSVMFTPDEVDELWYVNALHGITPVVSVDGDERAYAADRLDAWRAAAETWWVAI